MNKDDILSRALEEVFNESCEELTGLEVPDHEFSEDFEEKMEKLIEKLSEPEEKKRKGIVWKIVTAVVAVAAMLCLWTGIRNNTRLIQKDDQPNNIITDVNVPVTEHHGTAVTTNITEGTTVYTTAAETPASGTADAAIVSNRTVSSSGKASANTRSTSTLLKKPVITTIRTKTNDNQIITTAVASPATEHERSIIMKKVAAFLSALVTSSSLTMPAGNAEYIINRNSYYDPQWDIICKIDNGELDPDVTRDGKFDLDDCRAINYYYEKNYGDSKKDFRQSSGVFRITPETEAYIAKNFDIDGNGKITDTEEVALFAFFMEHNELKKEYFEPSYYDPNYVEGTETYEWYFTKAFKEETNRLFSAYPLFEKMVDNGEIVIDVNNDGKFDIYDFFIINAYVHLPSYSNTFDSDETDDSEIVESYIDYSQHYFHHPEELGFSENEINVCRALSSNRYFGNTDGALYLPVALHYYIGYYLVYHCEILPEYYNDSFYADFLPNADVSRFYTGVDLKDIVDSANEEIDSSGDMRLNVKTFEDVFYNYYVKAENGTAALPDLNRDGSMDRTDYDLMNEFEKDKWQKKTASESSIPADIWNHINNNCDFSGNGKSGDIYDMYIAKIYILLNLQTDLPKQETTSGSMTFKEQFAMLSNMDIKRSGDASCDGQLRMNDAVTILCHYSNPDDFQLSPKAEFNADINNTGDGITPMDALKVQRILIGVETN